LEVEIKNNYYGKITLKQLLIIWLKLETIIQK